MTLARIAGPAAPAMAVALAVLVWNPQPAAACDDCLAPSIPQRKAGPSTVTAAPDGTPSHKTLKRLKKRTHVGGWPAPDVPNLDKKAWDAAVADYIRRTRSDPTCLNRQTTPAPAPAVEAGYNGAVGGCAGSDRRLKRDIVALARRGDGIVLYRFRYYWSEVEYVGVMAQEVAEVRPDAVTRGADGFLRVNYGALGLKFRTWDDWVQSTTAQQAVPAP